MRKSCLEHYKKADKWKFISVIEGDMVIKSFELDEREKLTEKFPKMKPRKLIFEIKNLISPMDLSGAQFKPPAECQSTTNFIKGKEADESNNNKNLISSKSSLFNLFDDFDSPYESCDIFSIDSDDF